MRVGFIQFKPIFGDKERNLENMIRLFNLGVKKEALLLVAPELSNTGYRFKSLSELEKLSESVPEGESSKKIIQFAEENGIYIVAGICEKSCEGFFNSAILAGPEGFIGKYRKAHLFNEEKLWFKNGDTPFQVFKIRGAKIGIMICFDWFFPEVARILALKGAQIICHPSNLILPFCQTALLGTAVQNKVFIITANRIGNERGLKFTGMSQIVDPNMNILVRASKSREEVKVADIDPSVAEDKRVTERNDLWTDRRVDLYTEILKQRPPML
ncbi:acyltransferase [Candidatus Bathyarchaeota archaeon]|nr:MAG: acyltransferase [Candidatus Bathyarchaeota archaeon]